MRRSRCASAPAVSTPSSATIISASSSSTAGNVRAETSDRATSSCSRACHPIARAIWSRSSRRLDEPVLYVSLLTNTVPAARTLSEQKSANTLYVPLRNSCTHKASSAPPSPDAFAEQAKVPLGNVYYYFKTKRGARRGGDRFGTRRTCSQCSPALTAHRDPRARLRRLVRAPLDSADAIIEFGCLRGSLCQELSSAKLARARHSLRPARGCSRCISNGPSSNSASSALRSARRTSVRGRARRFDPGQSPARGYHTLRLRDVLSRCVSPCRAWARPRLFAEREPA